MISKNEQIQIHYEFAMSIGTSLDLQEMLKKSLTVVLRKLSCPAGGVHFLTRGSDGLFQLEKIISLPRNIDQGAPYQSILERINERVSLRQSSQRSGIGLSDFSASLPASGQVEDVFYAIFELPGLGFVVLISIAELDPHFIRSLNPIFQKLAVACNACLRNDELLKHQNNLQGLVVEKTAEIIKKNEQLVDEIKQRIISEEALYASEEKYRELVQNANSIILRWDTEGRVTFFNEYAQAFFGFSEEEIVGRHVVGTIVPATESGGRNLGPLMADICNHPQKYEYNVNENICKDGSRVWVAWTNKLLTDDGGVPIGALSIGADITKQKKIEEKLAERERSLAEAQKIAHFGNWSWDLDSNTLTWSDEVYRIFRLEPESFTPTYEAFLLFIHPDDRNKVNQAVNSALYEKKEYSVMHRIVLGNGEERMVQEHGRVSFDENDKPTRMVGVVQDITERYQSEQRFKLAAEAISDLIYEWDVKDGSLHWFGDIDRALGFTKGTFPHTLEAWLERIHPDDSVRLNNAVDHHRNSTDPISYEYQIQRNDGSWVYWSDYAVPILDGEGKPRKWIGACTDITENRKSVQKLVESEERYRALFTNEIDAICIFEVETKKIIEVNESWSNLYGYSQDESTSLTIDDISAEPEVTNRAVKRSVQVGSVFIPERRHRRKDGTVITVELAAGPYFWKGKMLMYALVRDITERKEAEDKLRNSEQLLAETQKIAQLGSWEFDVVSETIKWSTETFRIAGQPVKDSLSLQEYLDIVYPDDLPLLEAALDSSIAQRQPYEVELRHIRPDGSLNYTLTRGKPILEGDQVVKFIGSVLDITERKLAEQELQRAKEAAETANRAKSTFLANMSHELRTPLNVIIGFSELMTRDPSLSASQLKDLKTIVQSGEHLLSLINDVLEFSKIEAGRISVHQESFSLNKLLSGLEQMFHLRTVQKGISLRFEIEDDMPATIRTDQNKLRQILINLLGNAVKFTESGGITLKVTTNRRAPDGEKSDLALLQFAVIDSGSGIAPKEQERIFEAFIQAEEQLARRQGTGLGLPISRKFVELLGGTLEVDSEVGEGTRFEFTIPVERIDDAAPDFQSSRRIVGLAQGQPEYRLLVVDDDKNSRDILVKLLQSIGFDTKEAINGMDAIEVWRQWQPHLIWMDMRMPVLDGYMATLSIKNEITSSGSLKDTKIIALTASAFEEDRQKVIEHGGNDFVRKPFRESDILSMIEKHLQVEYLYEEDNRVPEAGPEHRPILDLTPAELSLPYATLEKLAEYAELSDTEMIDRVIDEIRTQHQPLADSLSHLAENFAYDTILKWVYENLDSKK